MLWLPLHYFDDSTYNSKEDKEWLSTMDSRLIALQKSVSSDNTPVYRWQESTLMDYKEGKF